MKKTDLKKDYIISSLALLTSLIYIYNAVFGGMRFYWLDFILFVNVSLCLFGFIYLNYWRTKKNKKLPKNKMAEGITDPDLYKLRESRRNLSAKLSLFFTNIEERKYIYKNDFYKLHYKLMCLKDNLDIYKEGRKNLASLDMANEVNDTVIVVMEILDRLCKYEDEDLIYPEKVIRIKPSKGFKQAKKSVSEGTPLEGTPFEDTKSS
jgi:hypothetical protein